MNIQQWQIMAVEKKEKLTKKRFEMSSKYPKYKEEEGQAIFELLVFLPIFLFLFIVVYTIGNSINVAINQEKVTRRYFYYMQRGNSFLPRMTILNKWKGLGKVTYSGISMMGYRDKLAGPTPVAYCFKFPSLLSGQTSETCEEPTLGEAQTSFVRIRTAYGVCGESYRLSGNTWIREYSNGSGIQNKRASETSCTISSN